MGRIIYLTRFQLSAPSMKAGEVAVWATERGPEGEALMFRPVRWVGAMVAVLTVFAGLMPPGATDSGAAPKNDSSIRKRLRWTGI